MFIRRETSELGLRSDVSLLGGKGGGLDGCVSRDAAGNKAEGPWSNTERQGHRPAGSTVTRSRVAAVATLLFSPTLVHSSVV